MNCARADCDHPAAIHNDAGCRRTSCKCDALVLPEPEQAPKGPRRVCIDVPDGYVLSISLIPDKEG